MIDRHIYNNHFTNSCYSNISLFCLMYAQIQSSIILKSLYSDDYLSFTHPKYIGIVPQSINQGIQIQDPIKECIYSNTIWIPDEMKSVHSCVPTHNRRY